MSTRWASHSIGGGTTKAALQASQEGSRSREDRFRARGQTVELREFMAADLDGNLIRVFYDFQGDT